MTAGSTLRLAGGAGPAPAVTSHAPPPLPAVMLGVGYWQADRLVLALVWLVHIGLDRLPGMGLKYGDRITHTHLGDRPGARGVPGG
jgi:Domain of unknown function (DUF4260)